MDAMNRPEYRNLTPHQIVPMMAENAEYIASESTAYRLLGASKQLAHRATSRPPKNHRPMELVATAPNQVWSWDITYLMTTTRGAFFYLYLVVDLFSRKIVAHAVRPAECGKFAAEFIKRACEREGILPDQLDLHQDNGAPMKNGTFKALLEALGILASYSRPGVSNDNPFSEALFRTMKYRPEFPTKPFESLDAAAAWVDQFVHWYNNEHRHSKISFVTPEQRHQGLDGAILAKRAETYEAARKKHPERWSGRTRNWSRIEAVELNPTARRVDREHSAA